MSAKADAVSAKADAVAAKADAVAAKAGLLLDSPLLPSCFGHHSLRFILEASLSPHSFYHILGTQWAGKRWQALGPGTQCLLGEMGFYSSPQIQNIAVFFQLSDACIILIQRCVKGKHICTGD